MKSMFMLLKLLEENRIMACSQYLRQLVSGEVPCDYSAALLGGGARGHRGQDRCQMSSIAETVLKLGNDIGITGVDAAGMVAKLQGCMPRSSRQAVRVRHMRARMTWSALQLAALSAC